MATITIQGTNEVIEGHQQVTDFLTQQEVIYEQWAVDQLPVHLQEKFDLTDAEKEEILHAFKSDIDTISERRGYRAADIISLSKATPNIEEMLKNFEREHHHTDDEVRFIVSGHGVFVIQGKDEHFFEVHLEPGDLISVPENIRHYFTLAADRQVVAVRILVTPEGWVAVY